MTIADRSLKRFHRIDYSTAHSDTALDTDGHEVLVMQNVRTDYIDMIPLSWETKPILESGGTYQGTHAGMNQPFLLLLSMPPSWQGIDMLFPHGDR